VLGGPPDHESPVEARSTSKGKGELSARKALNGGVMKRVVRSDKSEQQRKNHGNKSRGKDLRSRENCREQGLERTAQEPLEKISPDKTRMQLKVGGEKRPVSDKSWNIECRSRLPLNKVGESVG